MTGWPDSLHKRLTGPGEARPQADAVIDQVRSAVDRWEDFAAEAGISKARALQIQTSHTRGLMLTTLKKA
ncbi:MAG: hypothetical protein A2V88_07205 [Elusimicrobia bacterium RBG_16_66_12]|nr:MAG: hypothetical protein A2V88_07205 [Elusimicrobia bacterium RBG_16_66_12]